jgi:hypothetical protein
LKANGCGALEIASGVKESVVSRDAELSSTSEYKVVGDFKINPLLIAYGVDEWLLGVDCEAVGTRLGSD